MAYIPNTDADRAEMLAAIGLNSLDDLFTPIPKPLQFQGELNIPPRMDQITLARHLARTCAKKCPRGRLSLLSGRGYL